MQIIVYADYSICKLQSMQFTVYADCSLCRLQYMQIAVYADCSLCRLQYMQIAVYADYSLCRLQSMQIAVYADYNPCRLQSMQITVYADYILCRLQSMQIAVSWVMTPCSLVEISPRFRATYCRHLHSICTSSMHLMQRQYFFYHSTRRHITDESNLIVTGSAHRSSYRSTAASYVSNLTYACMY